MLSSRQVTIFFGLFGAVAKAQTVTVFEIQPTRTTQSIPPAPTGEEVLKGPIGTGTASNGKPLTAYIHEYRYSRLLLPTSPPSATTVSWATSTFDATTATYTEYLNDEEFHYTWINSEAPGFGTIGFEVGCTRSVGNDGNGRCVERMILGSETRTRTIDGSMKALTTVTVVPTAGGNNNNAAERKDVSIIATSIFLISLVFLVA